MPKEDVIYLADKKNSPYGTKSIDEIISLTKKDINRLARMGADKILIACCTASSVHDRLDGWEREISIPIITPASRVAAGYASVAVIATRHTVRQSAFGSAIRSLAPSCRVLERSEQELVGLVEGGCRDENINQRCKEILRSVAEWVEESAADALVLGCTHFSHLEKTLGDMLPRVKIISPAREGARALASLPSFSDGSGRIIYTDSSGVGLK